ncbi:hypothetical protein EYF80_001241 [Liparis tanakae]|uniref:Uncharacterized protein n=1 Tax=Liparis tanakae TaxID=230148 RepID=A0A4Z2JE08_9TELE|nr:hypothetical protein EYF80_001241 [Liparis tanakae]
MELALRDIQEVQEPAHSREPSTVWVAKEQGSRPETTSSLSCRHRLAADSPCDILSQLGGVWRVKLDVEAKGPGTG